jgi:hypothetical protein
MRALMASPARGATRALAPLRQRVSRFRASPARAELLPVRSNPLLGAVGKDGKPLTVLSAADGRPVSVGGTRALANTDTSSVGHNHSHCPATP